MALVSAWVFFFFIGLLLGSDAIDIDHWAERHLAYDLWPFLILLPLTGALGLMTLLMLSPGRIAYSLSLGIAVVVAIFAAGSSVIFFMLPSIALAVWSFLRLLRHARRDALA